MNEVPLFFDFTESSMFELELQRNTFWVPYSTLGKGKLSISEIRQLVSEKPEIKRQQICTLVDAINLFILSDFSVADDNIHIEEGEIVWEHYKPGKIAVISNEGSCAACASWGNYLLRNNFEESGYLSILRPWGGHVINYFFRNGWFYFMDFQPLVKSYRNGICKQTGLRKDFAESRYITGVLVKAKSINDYIHFYKRYTQNSIPEHLFIKHNSWELPPIGYNRKTNMRYIPKNNGSLEILGLPCEGLKMIKYRMSEFPEISPRWKLNIL